MEKFSIRSRRSEEKRVMAEREREIKGRTVRGKDDKKHRRLGEKRQWRPGGTEGQFCFREIYIFMSGRRVVQPPIQCFVTRPSYCPKWKFSVWPCGGGGGGGVSARSRHCGSRENLKKQLRRSETSPSLSNLHFRRTTNTKPAVTWEKVGDETLMIPTGKSRSKPPSHQGLKIQISIWSPKVIWEKEESETWGTGAEHSSGLSSYVTESMLSVKV